MRRRADLIPLSLALLVLPAQPPFALDAGECRANHAAFLAALATNREQRLAAMREALAADPDEAQRLRARHEGESAWDHEEQMRGLADRDLRDCLRHVESHGGGGPGVAQ
jgi:hypothetical protein